MPALEEFSSLVATLYEAAADPQHWPRFVVDFYKAMDATRGVLTARASEPTQTKVFLEGYTDAERRDYADYYYQHDTVLDAGLKSIEKNSHWIGPLEEIYSYDQLQSTEIYNDYYRDLNMHYASCVMVGPTGPYSALGMAAWRPRASGPFTPEQLHLVELLTPHLKRAFYLQAKLSSVGMEAHAFQSALNAASVAVFALRADGHVLATSGPAEALLTRKDSLLRRGGKLVALTADRDATLQRLIAKAAQTSALTLVESGGRSTQPGGALLLPRVGQLLALQVQVLPVRASGAHWMASPAVIVFVSDPSQMMPSRARLLHDLYRLTPLDGRLADLFLSGKEMKEAAHELSLSYEAVRFHMKQLFHKTGTRRQTELLRLLLSLTA